MEKKISLKENTEWVKVSHCPQIPQPWFEVYCESLEIACAITKTLWQYDIFQYENNIKPDYSNTTDIQTYNKETGEWESYYTEDGDDIIDVIEDEDY